MEQACCFSFDVGLCRNLEPEECLNIGGLPRGDGTWCDGTVPPSTGYDMIVCRWQACCYQLGGYGSPYECMDTTPFRCEDVSQGYLGEAKGWGTSCGAIGFDCNEEGFTVHCCLPDGQRLTDLMEGQCYAVGGTIYPPGEPCPPAPTTDDCGYAQLDRHPTGLRHWHRDTCQNAILEETKRYPEQEQGASFHYRRGYFEMVTRQPVRAMSLSERDNEPCQHQFVPVVIEDDGYAVGAFCSDRDLNELSRSMTIPVIAGNNPQFGRPGYVQFYAAYQTPLWTEVIFDSPLLLCGGGPV